MERPEVIDTLIGRSGYLQATFPNGLDWQTTALLIEYVEQLEARVAALEDALKECEEIQGTV